MPSTKLIYGVGRVPKASEFSLGEIIVNVDDSKVYSKSKNNIVFEIGGSSTTIIDGFGFSTASIESGGSFTSADTSNLIISGGTGIDITLDDNNHIIITATGESEVTTAATASYVKASNIDGTLFDFANDGNQGGIIFSETDIDIYSTVGAYAANLSETSNVKFGQVYSSGIISSSQYLVLASTENTTGVAGALMYSASNEFYLGFS